MKIKIAELWNLKWFRCAIVSLAGISLLLPIIIYFIQFFEYGLSYKTQDWAAFGSIYGGGLAGIAILLNTYLISKGMQLNRKHFHYLRNSIDYEDLMRSSKECAEYIRAEIGKPVRKYKESKQFLEVGKFFNSSLNPKVKKAILKAMEVHNQLESLSYKKGILNERNDGFNDREDALKREAISKLQKIQGLINEVKY